MVQPVAFDDQSARRTWRQVKADEQSRPSLAGGTSPPVQTPKIYTMVRVEKVAGADDDATAEEIKAAFVGEDLGFDFESLVVTCNEDAPVIPSSVERYDVNQAAFLEGCVLVGELFQAVNIGGTWYAIGCAHTAVMGEYSANGTVIIPDCNDSEVPVQSLTTDITLTVGVTYLAEWVRAQRVYIVTVSGCEEE